MTCYYCHKQGMKISDQGNCAQCKLAVCTDPPSRHDGIFHGSRCMCGNCGQLICKYDALHHATSQGGTVADCFGALAIGAGSTVLVQTADALNEGRTASRLPSETSDNFSEFLSFVTPGEGNLRQAIERSPDPALQDLTEDRVADNGQKWVWFDPEFFTEGALERIAALAAGTMRRAWHKGSRSSMRAVREWMDPQLAMALGKMGAAPTPSIPVAEELLRGVVQTGSKLPPSLIRALAYTAVPEGAEAVADWVIGATAGSTFVTMETSG